MSFPDPPPRETEPEAGAPQWVRLDRCDAVDDRGSTAAADTATVTAAVACGGWWQVARTTITPRPRLLEHKPALGSHLCGVGEAPSRPRVSFRKIQAEIQAEILLVGRDPGRDPCTRRGWALLISQARRVTVASDRPPPCPPGRVSATWSHSSLSLSLALSRPGGTMKWHGKIGWGYFVYADPVTAAAYVRAVATKGLSRGPGNRARIYTLPQLPQLRE